MFFIFNREKISSYIVASATIIFLFSMSVLENKNQTIEVSSMVDEKLPITIEADENEICLIIDNKRNADNIEWILEKLDKYNVKLTFCLSKEWAEKYKDKVDKIKKYGHKINISLQ